MYDGTVKIIAITEMNEEIVSACLNSKTRLHIRDY